MGHKWIAELATRQIIIQKDDMKCSCGNNPEINWQNDTTDDFCLVADSYCSSCDVNDQFQMTGMKALLEPILFCCNLLGGGTNCFDLVAIDKVSTPGFSLLRSITPSVEGLKFIIEPPVCWFKDS